MTNQYWLFEGANPKQLQDALDAIRGFGGSSAEDKLHWAQDEPDVERETETERITEHYAVRAIVQADFSADEQRELQRIGFSLVGAFDGSKAEKAVTDKMRTDKAKWEMDKPGKPPKYERKETKPEPEVVPDDPKGDSKGRA